MEKQDEVVQCLRSCLISTKGACDMGQLRRDYKMVMGGDVPFRELGYTTIEDFIKSIPTLRISKGAGGQLLVDAKPDEKSSHITLMVQKQKTSSKKFAPKTKYARSNSFHRPSTKWRPTNFGHKKSSYQTSSIPAAVSHNQFVTTPNRDSYSNKDTSPKKNYSSQSSSTNHSSHYNSYQNYSSQNYSSKNYSHKPNKRDTHTPPSKDSSPDQDRARYQENLPPQRQTRDTYSDSKKSDAKISDVRISDARISDVRISDARISDARISDARISDAKISDSMISDSKISYSMTSDNKTSKSKLADSKMSDTRLPQNLPRITRTINNNQEISVSDFTGPTLPRSKFVQKKVHFPSDDSSSECSSDYSSNSMSGVTYPFELASFNKDSIPPVGRGHRETYNGGRIGMAKHMNGSSKLFSSGSSTDSSSETAKEEKLHVTGDSLVDLYAFVQLKGLEEPVFKVILRKTKPHRPTYYDCSLKIGAHSFTSYPNDISDDISARQYVAKLALDKLIPQLTNNQRLLLSTADDILLRIPPIVEKHFHGVWNWQLEADYIDRFKEQLPSNWLDIVDTSPSISVERTLESKFVLRFCRPGEHFQKGKGSSAPLAYDISIPSNTIKFNESGTLQAEVTCIVSAKEIWCRQIDTPESEMFIKMSLFLDDINSSPYRLEGDALRATTITVGGYYIATYENSFFRVRVLDIVEDNVHCFQIDFGDDCILPKTDIYTMNCEFARNQAQAFICRLAGLEDLYEFSVQSEILQNLVGTLVQLEQASDSGEYDPNDPVLAVVMYDSETKDCLNKDLITFLTLESATPSLTEGVNEVVIKHIDNSGNIFVQVRSPGLEKLESLLHELQEGLLERFPNIKPQETLDLDRLYLAKYKDDDQWYRMQVLDMSPCKTYAQISFVDFGNTDVVKIASEPLLALDEISDVISQFPPQAVKVRMAIDVIPQNFAEVFNNLLQDDGPILLRILRLDENEVPLVEFYKRSEPGNALFSINKAITLEKELEVSGGGDGNNNKLSEKIQKLKLLNQFDDTTKNVPSNGSLKSPEIAKVGQYFDITVPHAVNPWNFFVQPYKLSKELGELQKKLQDRYGKIGTLSPLPIDEILPGKIYASKHTDGNWYRTSVIKVIGPGSISVCYCDYGYYSSVTVHQLLLLDPEFMDLPYQAIKAKLAGIKPRLDKWSFEDCKFFQNLVLRKAFVSVLISTERDELYPLDTVLSLNLFDTSTETDINIGQLMVNAKKAVNI